MNFLSELMDSVIELESPSSFYYWAGLTAISAVVKDNIWMDRGGVYKTYPNIYVMFHADSGLKKGPPVNLAKDLVKKVNNTRIISGRSSIQGILKELGTTETQPGGGIAYGGKSVAFICSSELTSSLVEDKAAAKILTDLYDRNYNEGEWKSLLKMESFKLKDPTITMLGATNAAMSEDFFQRDALHGGYFARTFIIYEREENTVNSLIVPPKKVPNRDELAKYLRELSVLKGPFVSMGSREQNANCFIPKQVRGETVYFTEVGKLYDDWYDKFRADCKEQGVKDETGTLNRFGDSVLKTAMLISLAKRPVLELDLDSMLEAIKQCEKLIGNIRKTTMGKKGEASNVHLKTLILEELFLRNPHMITRAQLSKKFWMHYKNIEELDEIMHGFSVNGRILTENRGSTIVYVMPDAQVEQLTKYFEGSEHKE